MLKSPQDVFSHDWLSVEAAGVFNPFQFSFLFQFKFFFYPHFINLCLSFSLLFFNELLLSFNFLLSPSFCLHLFGSSFLLLVKHLQLLSFLGPLLCPLLHLSDLLWPLWQFIMPLLDLSGHNFLGLFRLGLYLHRCSRRNHTHVNIQVQNWSFWF